VPPGSRLFTQALELCQKAWLVQLTHVAVSVLLVKIIVVEVRIDTSTIFSTQYVRHTNRLSGSAFPQHRVGMGAVPCGEVSDPPISPFGHQFCLASG